MLAGEAGQQQRPPWLLAAQSHLRLSLSVPPRTYCRLDARRTVSVSGGAMVGAEGAEPPKSHPEKAAA